jgi:phosphoserine phosphatase RsbU/P
MPPAMPLLSTTNNALTDELCRQFTRLCGWKLEYSAARRVVDAQQAELEEDPRCAWYAEIHDGGRPAGFLRLGRPEPHDERVDFSQAAGLAEALAQILGRLTEATAALVARNKDVSTLLNLGLSIPAQDDLAFSLSQLLKGAAHLTNSRAAAFFLLDPTTSRLQLRGVYQLSKDDIPNAERDLRASPSDLRALADAPITLAAQPGERHPLLPNEMRRALAVAVQSQHVPFGTLWVYDRRDKIYTDRDIQVLQALGAQVAAVLERAALVRGSEIQERLCRDVRTASESQSKGSLQNLPVDPRFEIAARCSSCYELGGDLCEILRISPDRLALVVGDASGNSIPAAMIMAAVRGALHVQSADPGEISALVGRLNNALCGITRSHQFMSLCYGVLDAECRRFTYSNAGHPVPILLRDSQAARLESHGLLLGVIEDAEYLQSTVQLDSGDLLVFYSDGISEAHGANGALFRCEGILEALLPVSTLSAGEILESIWNRVESHLGFDEPGDDRTLLVLRIT